MPSAYDYYDYPAYWKGREYEHLSEVFALKKFLSRIPSLKTTLDIGAGFGRLTPYYCFRAKKTILSDPSAKHLGQARRKLKHKKNIEYLQAGIETVSEKIRPSSIDLVILIRVLHHIKDIDLAFKTINKLLKKNGFLILEFANKKHLKAVISEFIKGNVTFPLDIFPKDLMEKRKKKFLPFKNFHPDIIVHKLLGHGFKIIEKRSVSNIRSPILKRLFPLQSLISLEEKLQKPLSSINFGPSIFILAQKRI